MNSEQDYIWSRQYALMENESYDDGLRRVANVVSRATLSYDPLALVEANHWERTYYELMRNNRFLPGGRVLAGAGSLHGNMLNCFVQDESPHQPGTTIGVLHLAKKLALVTKVGGGNGVNLTPIPPKKSVPEGQVFGKAYYAIHESHPDYDNLMAGRFMNLVVGEYEQRGYKVLLPEAEVPEDSEIEVLFIQDSIEGIWEAAATMVRRMLAGQSVVLDFSELRAEGTPVKGSGGNSSGPASFAVEVFDNFARWALLGGAECAGPVATLRYVYAPTLRTIRQGGVRRGAGMATLLDSHPDVNDFITCKDLSRERDEGDIGTFNISVLLTNATMDAYSEGSFNATALLHGIAEHAWSTGEPGVIFIDTVNANNPLATVDGPIMATNPCGEITLYPGEPCDLGAMNLAAYVREDNTVDTTALRRDVRTAVRFLDDVLTVEKSPLPEIHAAIQDKRRIGLGLMGLGDMLIRMGLRYDHEEGRRLVNSVISTMVEAALTESEKLAIERGIPEGVKRAGLDRRNIAIFTVAPTGTTSMLAGVSSGVEPVFSAVTYRRVGTEYRTIVHPLLVELLNEHEPTWAYMKPEAEKISWDWEKLQKDISEHHGSIRPLINDRRLPDSPKLRAFVTAHEVPPHAHVQMQAEVQKVFDYNPQFIRTFAGNSISKTINLPNEATVEDVISAYKLAFSNKAKGCTVYRDGSRSLQVLSTSAQNDEEQHLEELDEEQELWDTFDEMIRDARYHLGNATSKRMPVRPERVGGFTDKLQLGKNKVYVTVNTYDGYPVEAFINQSRPTPNERVAADVIGRLISVALKHGAPMEDIAKHLDGHHDETGGIVPGRGYFGSIWGAVASSLVQTPLVEPTVQRTSQPSLPRVNNKPTTCPDCNAPLVFEEGCHKCYACGYSKCG